jgi:nitroimidazol reductase NimA-like FMN-containing flavoprotein (pyridoxamine 5'-phosphate oxidase superfamily)
MTASHIDLIKMLAPRLERLSVDSIWARRASGLRRSLVKALEADEAGQTLEPSHLEQLIERTFDILTKSAREIPDPAHQLRREIRGEIMARNYEGATPTQFQRLPEYTRDEAWIRAFLHRTEIGHLGHARGEQPFVTPTNFLFDEQGHRIIFHSNIAGRMRDNLYHNPLVCFEVSEFGRFLPANTALEFGIQYRSVMVYGKVILLVSNEAKRSALYGLLLKYFPNLEPGIEYRPITDQELARTTVYALQIESWSGKENWPEKAEESPDWPPLAENLSA